MIDGAIKLLDQTTAEMVDRSLKIDIIEIDHLCYRTSSLTNYYETKKKFENYGDCLIESEVGGREIATFKLHSPIEYKNYVIDLIEVPAPKAGISTREGFEHIEFVVDQSFGDIISNNPNCNFDKKGLTKELNPELVLKFSDSAIKFHHKSLEHIINIEKNSEVLSFLKSSKILTTLMEFTPLLSGTIPIGINTDSSDLDIIFQSKNLEFFAKKVQNTFGNYKKFSSRTAVHQGISSLVVNFNHENLPVELFCQNRSVFKQNANQHLLIEGRLLKLIGKNFRDKIFELKKSGVKTEPAIGQLLNLDNPYLDLIKLNRLNDRDLIKLFANVF